MNGPITESTHGEARAAGPGAPRQRVLAALEWIRGYDTRWIAADLVAGLTLAAYVIPGAIGYSSLANLPAQAGLNACLFGGLVFWLFCGSRHTALAVTSAIAILVGASLGELSGGDETRYTALAACTALLVSAIAFVAWLFRAGSIVDFVSETVMTGFKCGVGLYLASSQLPKLFGVKGGEGNFWERSAAFLGRLGDTNTTSLAAGTAALVLLFGGKALLKNKPVALFVVIGGIVASSWLGFEAKGVKLLGDVPQGLPPVRVPAVAWSDLDTLLPLAAACFLLAAVESAAIGRMFAAKHGGRFRANQEFLALAGANLAAGFGQGLPVSGGMSQSLVNESGGAKTPLSGLVSSLLILVVVVFFAGSLHDLPQPVLAAIVLVAVASLIKVKALKELWTKDRREFLVASAALLGVLFSGLLRGVLIGAVISLVILVRRAARPHVAILGRIPGTDRYSDMERNPGNEAIPGVVIVRPEASVVYFNVEHVRDRIVQHVRAGATPPRLVILDLTSAPRMDLQAAGVLSSSIDELAALGTRMQIVEARAAVRERLRAEGIDVKVGNVNRFTSVDDAVKAHLAAESAAPAGTPG
jgi:high affinity sulfate transporter 1